MNEYDYTDYHDKAQEKNVLFSELLSEMRYSINALLLKQRVFDSFTFAYELFSSLSALDSLWGRDLRSAFHWASLVLLGHHDHFFLWSSKHESNGLRVLWLCELTNSVGELSSFFGLFREDKYSLESCTDTLLIRFWEDIDICCLPHEYGQSAAWSCQESQTLLRKTCTLTWVLVFFQLDSWVGLELLCFSLLSFR